jgi:hypothetical protein
MFSYHRAVGSFILIGSCLAFTARVARAQDTVPPVAQPSGEKTSVERAAEITKNIFDKPLHLTVSSVAPGGGLTAGVGFAPKPWSGNRYFTSMRAAVSVKKFWITEGGVGWQNDGYARVEAFGRVRQMTQLGFFGLGSDALRANQTSFLMTERTVGATAWIKPQPRLKLTARVEEIGSSLSTGQSPLHPSIEAIFDDTTAPGLLEQPTYFHAQAVVDVIHPPTADDLYTTGGDFRAAYGIFRGRTSTGSASFDRFELEAQQHFALPKPSRRITLRVWASSSRPDSGARVPFFIMQTLGGSGSLRAYEDPMLGGDETQATLRGFTNYRFRGLNLVLVQAEYRMKLYGPVDLSFFTDQGTVGPRLGDLNVRDLHHDYGFAVSLMQKHKTAARFDFGFGGGEGMHVFFSVGKVSTR